MKNKYEVRGETVAIPVSGRGFNAVATIDVADLAHVDSFRGTWLIFPNQEGTLYVRGIIYGGKCKTTVSLHRWIIDPPPDMLVDHINGDPLNNRRSNLRIASHGTNALNINNPRPNATGFPGVTVLQRKTTISYRAEVKFRGRKISAGCFRSPEEAHAAYLRKRDQLLNESIAADAERLRVSRVTVTQ